MLQIVDLFKLLKFDFDLSNRYDVCDYNLIIFSQGILVQAMNYTNGYRSADT